MGKNKPKMKCPYCGAEMNFHAEKINYEAETFDPVFEGTVEEVHSCPRCGRTAVRPAS